MAQAVRCMLYRNKDLNLRPRTHVLKIIIIIAIEHTFVISALGRWRQEDSLGPAGLPA